MPAGTGVCVVNTVPARVTSSAVSKSRPRAVLGHGQLADPLEAEEAGVALVGVEDLGLGVAGDPRVGAQGAHAADAEQQLLEQAVLGGAAVQPVGHLAQRQRVVLDVGVEQQQRHPADLRDEDARDELGVARASRGAPGPGCRRPRAAA